MSSIGLNREVFLAELAADGVDKVRMKIAQGAYRKEKLAIAQEWLWRQERALSASREARIEARASRAEASALEANQIARNAKNAAWAAAIAAIIAMIITACMAVIAYLSMK